MCMYIAHGSSVVDDEAYMQLGTETDMQKNSYRNISCPVNFTLVWFDLFIGMHAISLLQSLRKIITVLYSKVLTNLLAQYV